MDKWIDINKSLINTPIVIEIISIIGVRSSYLASDFLYIYAQNKRNHDSTLGRDLQAKYNLYRQMESSVIYNIRVRFLNGNKRES